MISYNAVPLPLDFANEFSHYLFAHHTNTRESSTSATEPYLLHIKHKDRMTDACAHALNRKLLAIVAIAVPRRACVDHRR